MRKNYCYTCFMLLHVTRVTRVTGINLVCYIVLHQASAMGIYPPSRGIYSGVTRVTQRMPRTF